MNQVKISGTLTKAPYFADKGWCAGTLAVEKPGSTYKLWVPFYCPAAVAESLKGAQANEGFILEGELDEGKRDDKKFLQLRVKKATPERGAKRDVMAETHITDDDIPF